MALVDNIFYSRLRAGLSRQRLVDPDFRAFAGNLSGGTSCNPPNAMSALIY
jgi:hypothetical protein